MSEEKRRPVACGKSAKGGGVKAVLGGQDAGGKAVFGVAGQDGHAGLAKEGACVKVSGDFVDSAARLGIARRKGAGVGVEARVFRQKRGVDVQHPPFESLDEAGAQDAHETRKAKDIRPGGIYAFGKQRLKPRTVFAERAVIDRRNRNAQRCRFRQPFGRWIVRADKDGLGVTAFGHIPKKCQHVGATPGNQDGDALHSRRPL